MTLVGFQARNHRQQVEARGADRAVDDRATTVEVFDPLNRRFGGFTVDAAAAPDNTKCGRFWSIDDDGLAQSWAGERVWCNPPYSAPNLERFVAKAWAEHRRAECIVMLLPANRTEQRWWTTLVEPYRDRPGSALTTEFLPGRLRFLAPGRGVIRANERPPFGCVLLIWQHSAPEPPASLFDGVTS